MAEVELVLSIVAATIIGAFAVRLVILIVTEEIERSKKS